MVERLIMQLDPSLDPELHSIASQSIVDLVAISHINATTNGDQPVSSFNDSILCEIKSTPIIKKLISFMLDPVAPHSTSSLECGIDVLIELMRRSVL